MSITYEGQMFGHVKDFLISKYSSVEKNFGYDSHKAVPNHLGWSVLINNYCSNPDVYGITDDGKVIFCQGKVINNKKGKLWELVGQAISNRNYCNYLFIFFERNYYEKMSKVEVYEDFKSILNQFKLGLLVVSDKFQVKEVVSVQEQENPTKENINLSKTKISNAIRSINSIKEFVKTIENSIKDILKKTPYIHLTYINTSQPVLNISIEEWQKEKEKEKEKYLTYLVKFEQKRVRVGINVSNYLIEKSFKNFLLSKIPHTFTRYNLNNIDDQFRKEDYILKAKKLMTFT